jgi:hypothetical protein
MNIIKLFVDYIYTVAFVKVRMRLTIVSETLANIEINFKCILRRKKTTGLTQDTCWSCL